MGKRRKQEDQDPGPDQWAKWAQEVAEEGEEWDVAGELSDEEKAWLARLLVRCHLRLIRPGKGAPVDEKAVMGDARISRPPCQDGADRVLYALAVQLNG